MSIPKMEIPKRSSHRFPVILRTPINLDFIEDLKRTVPKSERTYDGVKYIWRVSDAYRPAAALAVLRHWPEMMVMDRGEDYIVTRNGQRITQTQLF